MTPGNPNVQTVIAAIRAGNSSLDGVFINAGVGYAARRVETVDGMDTHFQVNYLSQFMLTPHLLDLLEKSDSGGRVVFNVTRHTANRERAHTECATCGNANLIGDSGNRTIGVIVPSCMG